MSLLLSNFLTFISGKDFRMKVLNSFTGVSRELNVMFMPGYGHFFNQASSYCFIQNVTI